MSKHARPEAYSAIQEAIGRRIEWARTLVYPVRAEMADLLGVDPSTLAKIESGDRAPSVFNVVELSKQLGVSTDFLLKGLLVAHTNTDMALQLAAMHPELVLPPEYTAASRVPAPRPGRAAPPLKRSRGG